MAVVAPPTNVESVAQSSATLGVMPVTTRPWKKSARGPHPGAGTTLPPLPVIAVGQPLMLNQAR